jgi:hypothetical protein
MEVKKLEALTEKEIAEAVNDSDSDIDFIPESSPSES